MPSQLPPILRDAVDRIVEVGFAGFAPTSDAFAGQKLYLEWCTDEVFGGFLIPEQDLEFLQQAPSRDFQDGVGKALMPAACQLCRTEALLYRGATVTDVRVPHVGTAIAT